MEPQGLGALQLAFEQLKKKLQAEGLFDSGAQAAAAHLAAQDRDRHVARRRGAPRHLKVLRRRHPNVHLVIRPTRVQGDGAPAEIVRALRAIATVTGVDVIIAARGGGSAEDLQAFNDEGVARAIAASPMPVISAIGHEVDFTIADFVADLRAPTPSAAAEMVVAAKDEFCARIDSLKQRLDGAIAQSVAAAAPAAARALEPSGPGGLARCGCDASDGTRQKSSIACDGRQRRLLARRRTAISRPPAGTGSPRPSATAGRHSRTADRLGWAAQGGGGAHPRSRGCAIPASSSAGWKI